MGLLDDVASGVPVGLDNSKSITPASGTKKFDSDQFITDTLKETGVPITDNTKEAMRRWLRAEGNVSGDRAMYNPLNTTWHMPGDSDFGGPNQNNGNPVRSYPDYKTGLTATVHTLLKNHPQILEALSAAKSPEEALKVIASSKWGTTASALGVNGQQHSQESHEPAESKGLLDELVHSNSEYPGNTGTGLLDELVSSPEKKDLITPSEAFAPGETKMSPVEDLVTSQQGWVKNIFNTTVQGIKSTAKSSWNYFQDNYDKVMDEYPDRVKSLNIARQLNNVSAEEYQRQMEALNQGYEKAKKESEDFQRLAQEDDISIAKHPVSNWYQFKQDLNNALGSQAGTWDKIRYNLPNTMGSSMSLMLPQIAGAYGTEALGAALGAAEIPYANVAALALAGLAAVAGRYAETTSEVGSNIMDNRKALMEKWMIEHPGQQISPEDIRQIRMKAREGTDQQIFSNMLLSAPDLLEMTILPGSSLWKMGAESAGSLGKFLNKIDTLGEGSKLGRLGVRGAKFYTGMVGEKFEEGLQQVAQYRQTDDALNTGLYDNEGFMRNFLADSGDVFRSLNYSPIPGITIRNHDGRYSLDPEFQTSEEAGGLLSAFMGGFGHAAGIAGDVYKYSKYQKALNSLNGLELADPDLKTFRARGDLYYNAINNGNAHHVMASISTLANTIDEKTGKPYVSKEEAETQVGNLKIAMDKFNTIQKYVDDLLPGSENSEVKENFKRNLFNNALSFEIWNSKYTDTEQKKQSLLTQLYGSKSLRELSKGTPDAEVLDYLDLKERYDFTDKQVKKLEEELSKGSAVSKIYQFDKMLTVAKKQRDELKKQLKTPDEETLKKSKFTLTPEISLANAELVNTGIKRDWSLMKYNEGLKVKDNKGAHEYLKKLHEEAQKAQKEVEETQNKFTKEEQKKIDEAFVEKIKKSDDVDNDVEIFKGLIGTDKFSTKVNQAINNRRAELARIKKAGENKKADSWEKIKEKLDKVKNLEEFKKAASEVVLPDEETLNKFYEYAQERLKEFQEQENKASEKKESEKSFVPIDIKDLKKGDIVFVKGKTNTYVKAEVQKVNSEGKLIVTFNEKGKTVQATRTEAFILQGSTVEKTEPTEEVIETPEKDADALQSQAATKLKTPLEKKPKKGKTAKTPKTPNAENQSVLSSQKSDFETIPDANKVLLAVFEKKEDGTVVPMKKDGNENMKYELKANPEIGASKDPSHNVFELELDENEYWNGIKGSIPEDQWYKSIPIVIKAYTGDNVDRVERTKEDKQFSDVQRKEIYDLLKSGHKVIADGSKVWRAVADPEKQTGSNFLNFPERRFGLKETFSNGYVQNEKEEWELKNDLPIVLGGTTGVSQTITSEDGEVLASVHTLEEPHAVVPNIKNTGVSPETIAKIEESASRLGINTDEGEFKTLKIQGMIHAYVADPNGNYIGVPLSTKTLNPNAVQKVLELLADNKLDEADELVNTHSIMETAKYNKFFLNIFEATKDPKTGEKELVIQFNPGFSNGKLLKVTSTDLKVALETGTPIKPEFVGVVQEKQEDGRVFYNLKKVGTPKELSSVDAFKELQKFLLRKRFNVKTNLLNSKEEKGYTSVLTGIPYGSYNEYLMSEKEDTYVNPNYPNDNRAILTTDLVNYNGSVFYNVGINLKNIRTDKQAEKVKEKVQSIKEEGAKDSESSKVPEEKIISSSKALGAKTKERKKKTTDKKTSEVKLQKSIVQDEGKSSPGNLKYDDLELGNTVHFKTREGDYVGYGKVSELNKEKKFARFILTIFGPEESSLRNEELGYSEEDFNKYFNFGSKANEEEAPFFIPSTKELKASEKSKKTIEQRLKYLQDRFNILGFDITDIRSIYDKTFHLAQTQNGFAHGMLHNALVYLYKNAIPGTEYHEAFHVAFRMLLNEEQQRSIMEEAYKRYEKPSEEELEKLKKVNKSLSEEELKDLYYEEKMAEDFRLKELKNETPKVKGLFPRILQWFKDLFNYARAKVTGRYTLDQLFKQLHYNDFTRGQKQQYIKRKIQYLNKEVNDADPAYILKEGQTERSQKVITDGLVSMALDLINKIKKDTGRDADVNQVLKGVRAQVLMKMFKDQSIPIVKMADYYDDFISQGETPEGIELEDDETLNELHTIYAEDEWETQKDELGNPVNVGWKDLIIKQMPQHGFDVYKNEEDKRIEEEVEAEDSDDYSQDGQYYGSHFHKNTEDNLSADMRAWLASITNPKSPVFGPLGTRSYFPFREVYSGIKTAAVDSLDYAEMVDFLEYESNYKPFLKEVLTKLKSLSKSQRNEFYRAFNLHETETNTSIISQDANGNTIYQQFNSDRRSLSNKLLDDWLQASRTSDEGKSDAVYRVENEELKVNEEQLKVVIDAYNKLQSNFITKAGEKAKKVVTPEMISSLHEVLNALGIKITEQELEKTLDTKVQVGRKILEGMGLFKHIAFPHIKNFITDLADIKEGKGKAIESWKAKETPVDFHDNYSKVLRRYSRMFEKFSLDTTGSFMAPDGRMIFGINLPSSFTKTFLEMQRGEKYDKNDPNNAYWNSIFFNPFNNTIDPNYKGRYHSLLLEYLQEEENREDFGFQRQLDLNIRGEKGTKTTPEDINTPQMRQLRLNMFLNNGKRSTKETLKGKETARLARMLMPIHGDRGELIFSKDLPTIGHFVADGKIKSRDDIWKSYIYQDILMAQQARDETRPVVMNPDGSYNLKDGGLPDDMLMENWHYNKKSKDKRDRKGNIFKFTQLPMISKELQSKLIEQDLFTLDEEQKKEFGNLINQAVQEVNQYIANERAKTIRELEKWGIVTLDKDGRIADKEVTNFKTGKKSKVKDTSLSIEGLASYRFDLTQMVDDAVSNDIFWTAEFNKFFQSNLAQYVDFEDSTKRAGMMSSPGWVGFQYKWSDDPDEQQGINAWGEDEHTRILWVQDPVNSPSLQDTGWKSVVQMMKELGVSGAEMVDKYYQNDGKTKTADSQSVQSIYKARKYWQSIGGKFWIPEDNNEIDVPSHERAFKQYLKTGEWFDPKMRTIEKGQEKFVRGVPKLPVVKTSFHTYIRVGNNLYRVSVKHSIVTLLKEFTKDHPIMDDMRQYMEQVGQYKTLKEQGIPKTDILTMPSAGKEAKWNIHSIDYSAVGKSQFLTAKPITFRTDAQRTPQIIPIDKDDAKSKLAAQFWKQMLTNLDMLSEKAMYSVRGARKAFTAKDIFNLVQDAHAALIKKNLDSLYKELSYKEGDMTPEEQLKFMQKLRDKLLSNNEDRDLAEAYDKAVHIVKVLENGEEKYEFQVDLSFPSLERKFQQIVASMFRKRVMNPLVRGKSFVQIAELGGWKEGKHLKFITAEDKTVYFGKENYSSEKDLKEGLVETAGMETYIPKEGEVLKQGEMFEYKGSFWFITKLQEDRMTLKRISHAEIAMPHKIARDFGIPTGDREMMSKIPEAARSIILYRIPTPGKNAVLPAVVAYTIPEGMGSQMMVPGLIVRQMGSDFDVDKVYTLQRNLTQFRPFEFSDKLEKQETKFYEYVRSYVANNSEERFNDISDEKIKNTLESFDSVRKVEPFSLEYYIIVARDSYDSLVRREDTETYAVPYDLTKPFEDQKVSSIENFLIDAIEGTLLNPQHLNEVLQVTDTETFGDLIDEITPTIGTDRKISVSEYNSKEKIFRINQVGNALRGLFSNFMSGYSIAQYSNLKLNATEDTDYRYKFKNDESSDEIILEDLNRKKENKDLKFTEDQLITTDFMEIVQQTIDDPKDPKLFKLNFNLFTTNTVGGMVHAGTGNRIPAYFINQPIVRYLFQQYTNEGLNPNDIYKLVNDTAKKLNSSTKLDLKLTLKKTRTINLDRLHETVGNESLISDIISGKNKNFDPQWVKEQFDYLNNFYIFNKVGGDIRKVNKAVMADRISEMIDLGGVESWYDNYRYVTDPERMQTISGVQELLDGGQYKIEEAYRKTGIDKFKDFADKFFPFSKEAFTEVKAEILDLLNRESLTRDEHNFINSELFLYTFTLPESPLYDIFTEDYVKELLIDSKTNITVLFNNLKKSHPDFFKENLYFSKVKEHRDNSRKGEELHTLTFMNERYSKAEKDRFSQSLTEALQNDNEEIRDFVKKYIHSVILSIGFTPDSSNMIELFDLPIWESFTNEEEKNILEFYKEQKENFDDPEFFKGFISDFMANNAGYAGLIPNIQDVDTKQSYINVSKGTYSVTKGGDKASEYVRAYSKKDGMYFLYKYVEEDKETIVYKRINTKGNNRLKEYNFRDKEGYPLSTSVLKKNNAVKSAPDTKSSTEEKSTKPTPSPDDIYSKLGNKTKSENVKIKGVYQKKGVEYARSLGGVFSLRIKDSNKHFGNPWTHNKGLAEQDNLILVDSVEEAVRNYIDWLTTSKFNNIEPERRAWILGQIKGGNMKGRPIVYWKELGEPSHATALDYLINKHEYNWNKPEDNIQKQKGSEETEEVFDVIQQKVTALKESFAASGVNVKIEFDGELDHPAEVEYKDGKPIIRINPNLAFKDTIFHEFGHIYIDLLGYDHPIVQEAIMQLRGSSLYKQVEAAYPELSQESLDKEVLATSLGKKASDVWERGGEKKESLLKIIWNRIWRAVSQLLGITKDASERLAEELAKGDLRTKDFNSKNLETPSKQLSKGTSPVLTKVLDEVRVSVYKKIKIYEKKGDEASVKKLKDLYLEITKLEDVKAVVRFIEIAYEQTIAAGARLEEALSKPASHAVIEELVKIQEYISGFAALDEIRELKEFRNLGKTLEQTKDNQILNKLEKAINERDKIKKTYLKDGVNLMADWIYSFDTGGVNKAANEMGLLGEKYLVSKERIAEQLRTALRDESTWRMLFSPLISIKDDAAVALFAKAVMKTIWQEEQDTIEDDHELRKIIKEFADSSGRNPNNAEKFYEGVYEDVTEYWYNEKTKKHEERKVRHFVRPIDYSAFNKAKKEFFDSIKGLKKNRKLKILTWYLENTEAVPNAIDILREKEVSLTKEEYEKYLKQNHPDDHIWKGELSQPKMSKYSNKKYAELQANPALAELHKKALEFKLKKDLLIPDYARTGTRWYSIRKSDKDILREEGAKALLKKTKDEDFSIQAYDTQYGIQTESGEQFKAIPLNHIQFMDAHDVTHDLYNMLYNGAYMTNAYKQRNEIASYVHMFKDILGNRAVPITNTFGERVKDAVAQGINIEKFILKEKGTSNTLFHVRSWLDMVYFNEPKLRGTSIPIGNKEISVNKTLDSLIKFTALDVLATNIMQGVNNVLVGKIMMFSEAMAGDYYNYKDMKFADKEYLSNIGQLLGDIGSFEAKSKITQLIEKYDFIQGRFEDSLGNNITGNAAKHLFSRSALFFQTHVGEHYLQTRAGIAMLEHTKVKDKDGKEISLYDAYEVDPNTGLLKLKDGVQWSKEDEFKLTLRIANHNNKINGSYNRAHKQVASRYVGGRMLLLFRNWIEPGFRRRWGAMQADFEKDDIVEGNYITFFRTLYNELKAMKLKMFYDWSGYTNLQKQNIRRTLGEIGMFMVAAGFVFALKPDKGDDDRNWIMNFTLYQARRLQADIMFYSDPTLQSEWQILRSPTATMGLIENTGRMIHQLFTGPFDTYQRRTGIHQAGDSKLYDKLERILPVLGRIQSLRTPEEAYKAIFERN